MSRGAVHNALPRGPFASALARALGDTVGATGLERYGETLTPVLDLWSMPEWAYLRGEQLVGARTAQTAVAGEYSAGGILNPTGSGLLLVVEDASAYAASAGLILLTRATEAVILGTLATGNPGYARDTRVASGTFFASGGPTVIFGSDAASPIAGSLMLAEESNPAGEYARFGQGLPVILSPGHGLIMQAETVNLTVRFNMAWRQRKALPGELE